VNCRNCGASLGLTLLDLGSAPPSNALLTAEQVTQPETSFPLRVLVCERCWLVQTEDFAKAEELFDAEYPYFSGYSSSWLAHIERYVDEVVRRFRLDAGSLVVEVGANDGSLLEYVKAAGIDCFGIEPTASTASAARAKGIRVVEAFFGADLARELASDARADLIVANNVLAHVPDINDFVAGFSLLLEPDGVATFEFPHVVHLIAENQFDTVYHEHFSYLSLTVVNRVFAANGLAVFDVEELATHGGSLRVFGQRADVGRRPHSSRVDDLLACEARLGIASAAYYQGFQRKAEGVKNAFLRFLLEAAESGKMVAAYGAAAKGNTLLNFAGVRPDLIRFVVDANPAKQGKFLPGSHIPIVAEERLHEQEPAFVVLLPWNLRSELRERLGYVRSWGGRLVTAVPQLDVLP
jgi:2-polyprenyl-3-methyl-5-hydroxy-6-metoxy-1,4-benzoquinol methylase